MDDILISPTNNTTSGGLTALSITEYVLFTIIFIISFVGNFLVCLVIYKTPRMHTTRNYLIVNLALADLTVALVCIPFDVVFKVYSPSWPLGAAMCKIVWPLMTSVTTCSAATLLAISYDRYRAVVRLQKALSSIQTTAVISATWLISLLLVIPYVVALRINKKGECDEKWLSVTIKQLYTIGLLVFQYALPLFFIAIAYAAVVNKLRKQAQNLTAKGVKGGQSVTSKKDESSASEHEFSSIHSRVSESETHRSSDLETRRKRSTSSNFPAINAKSEAKRIERNKKIVKMLMSVVLVYAICLLPNQLVWLWIEFGSGGNFEHINTLLTFSSLLVYINSTINPLLYAGMNTQFRKGFGKALGFHRKRKLRRGDRFQMV